MCLMCAQHVCSIVFQSMCAFCLCLQVRVPSSASGQSFTSEVALAHAYSMTLHAIYGASQECSPDSEVLSASCFFAASGAYVRLVLATCNVAAPLLCNPARCAIACPSANPTLCRQGPTRGSCRAGRKRWGASRLQPETALALLSRPSLGGWEGCLPCKISQGASLAH